MLNQLRKHAKSWVVKVTLTLIILTFMFFFGYQKFASNLQDRRNYVAMVGNDGIPRRVFDVTLQVSLDRMRKNFGGEIPQNFEELLKQNVLDQLISRSVLSLYANALGLSVSDEEVALKIETNRDLFPDGFFDLGRYTKQFLPAYHQRYGEDFEASVSRDLLIEKTRDLLSTVTGAWQEDLNTSLSEIHASLGKMKPKNVAELLKSIESKKNPETSKAKGAETQIISSLPEQSLPSDEYLSYWVNNFREKVKINVLKEL